MQRVFRSTLPSHLRMVLIAIADGANEDGVCWPGQTKLADKSGLGDRALRKGLTQLVDMGYLVVDRKGNNRTNWYHVLIDDDGRPTGTTVPVGPGEGQEPQFRTDRNHSSGPDRNHSSGPIKNPQIEPPVEPPVFAPAAHKPRPRNELWDAVAAVFGEPSNERLKGRRAKAVALMRESGVTPDEVETLANVYRWKSKGEWVMSDIALAGRVDDCRRWALESEQGNGKTLAAAVDRKLENESLKRAFQRMKDAGPPDEPAGLARTDAPLDWFDLAAGGET